MLDANDTIKRAIVQRANKLQYEKVYELIGGRPFILAGGALCGDKVHDFDIYPSKANPYIRDEIERKLTDKTKPVGADIVAVTKNALTVLLEGGQTVQFCSYMKQSLTELVKSFDFAHIQVGILFQGDNRPPQIDSVFYTDDFVAANVTRCTHYTGSEYPTSSIIRALKYYKRGKMNRSAAVRSVVHALADMVNRGFADYNDFKDQLDAIDLGLLPECHEAIMLHSAVSKAGLIRNK